MTADVRFSGRGHATSPPGFGLRACHRFPKALFRSIVSSSRESTQPPHGETIEKRHHKTSQHEGKGEPEDKFDQSLRGAFGLRERSPYVPLVFPLRRRGGQALQRFNHVVQLPRRLFNFLRRMSILAHVERTAVGSCRSQIRAEMPGENVEHAPSFLHRQTLPSRVNCTQKATPAHTPEAGMGFHSM
jgi:hypothetical protein